MNKPPEVLLRAREVFLLVVDDETHERQRLVFGGNGPRKRTIRLTMARDEPGRLVSGATAYGNGSDSSIELRWLRRSSQCNYPRWWRWRPGAGGPL